MSTSISFPYDILVCEFFVQHELGLAADDGVRHLVEQSEGEVTPADKASAMSAAIEKKAVALRIKMGKLVAVANPELTDGWLREVGALNLCLYQPVQLILEKRTRKLTNSYVTQIERHYTLNSLSPELNLEKLQLIATSKVSPAWKIKWLEYFNSSASTREARRLPPKPINEERLINFLAKASFWAGVSPLIS